MNTRRTSGLGIFIAACLTLASACVESEDPEGGPSGVAGSNGSGVAGTTGIAGTSGGAGTTGTAGTTGNVGVAGTTGTAGTKGSAGTTGAAGTSATTGSAGSNGTGSAGTTGTDGGTGPATDASADAGGTAPTFTNVYNLILGPTPMVAASSCAGGACHLAPGGGKGLEHINMNTKALAYTGVKKFVVAGNPTASKMFTEVNTGAMPEGKPKLPANLIKLISDWIKAGALDN